MKKNKIIVLLFTILLFIVAGDLYLIFLKKKNNVSEPPVKEQEILDKAKANSYLCKTLEKTSDMSNKSQFHFVEEYEFFVLENKINNGRYQDTIFFKNEADYQYFIDNYINQNNTYYSIDYEKENLKIVYHKNMILKKNQDQSLDSVEKYLEYMNELGFDCEK